MKITPKNFYPSDYKEHGAYVKGTMHIVIDDMRIELKGITFFKSDNKWRFFLLGGRGIDHKGKPCFYPYFWFIDEDSKKDFKESLLSTCIPFIENYIKDNIPSLEKLSNRSKSKTKGKPKSPDKKMDIKKMIENKVKIFK